MDVVAAMECKARDALFSLLDDLETHTRVLMHLVR